MALVYEFVKETHSHALRIVTVCKLRCMAYPLYVDLCEGALT
jgi:hypothetical protein